MWQWPLQGGKLWLAGACWSLAGAFAGQRRLLIGKGKGACRAALPPADRQASEQEGKGMYIVEVHRGTMPYHYGPFKNRSEALCFAKREITPLGYRWRVFVLYGRTE